MEDLQYIFDFLEMLFDCIENDTKPQKPDYAHLRIGQRELGNVIRFLEDFKKGCEDGSQSIIRNNLGACRLADFGLCACPCIRTKAERNRANIGTETNDEER